MRWHLLLVLGISASATAQQPVLIGYYAGDGRNLEEHRLEQLTHLIWCFSHVRNDSMVVHPTQDPIIARMVKLKERNPGMKVLLSLGGWGGCADCSETFSRADGRNTFARSVRQLMERHQVDGIDLDWEYPAVQGPPGHLFSDSDRHHFTLLVRALRNELGPHYELSFAAGGTDECLIKGYEWDSIMPLVDRMHIMSYDLVHGYSTHTGHHTSLFATAQQRISADRAVDLLDSLGVPLDKVVIGAAFYARIFKDVPAEHDGLHQPGSFSHTISCSAIDTTITEANGWHLRFDKRAWAAYAYHPDTRRFITYDEPMSIAAKAAYVRSRGLGGIMFWQLIDDRPENGLLQVMYDALSAP
ncbi:MAG: glycoside hydrolase [Flavobacteriales bacterium]|nr:glycoside hydrolase [Flavobacteriales bacterium]